MIHACNMMAGHISSGGIHRLARLTLPHHHLLLPLLLNTAALHLHWVSLGVHRVIRVGAKHAHRRVGIIGVWRHAHGLLLLLTTLCRVLQKRIAVKAQYRRLRLSKHVGTNVVHDTEEAAPRKIMNLCCL